MLEHKIHWKFSRFLWWPWVGLEFFFGKVKFAFWAFIWEDFMDFIDFGAQLNKYSYLGEHMNIFFALEV